MTKTLICFLAILFLQTIAQAQQAKLRDPFESVVSTAIERNLSDYSINNVKLVGVIKDGSATKSQKNSRDSIVVSDPSNHLYFLKLGDKIGLESAKIKQILSDVVILEWLVQGQIFIDRLKLTLEE